MSSSNKPMKPPLNATNSWVIRRARDLIGYDDYDIEQWLDNVTDGDFNGNGANNTSACPVSMETCSGANLGTHGHPAGEPKDYDPDRKAISEKTIVETLEALVAEMEASYIDGTASHTSYSSSSSLSHSYKHLPSDSLENQSLIDHDQGTNSGSTIGSRASTADSDVKMDSPLPSPDSIKSPIPVLIVTTPSAPASDAGLTSGVKSKSQRPRHPARPASSPDTASSPPNPSQSKPKSPFLTVPRPTRRRPNKPSRQGNKIFIYPEAYAEALANPPEIQRCPSPMPHVRLPFRPPGHPASPFRPAPMPLSSHPIPDPISGGNIADSKDVPRGENPKQARRRRRNRDDGTPVSETIRPVPQLDGRLLVPVTPRRHFVASPFAEARGCGGGEVPVLVIGES